MIDIETLRRVDTPDPRPTAKLAAAKKWLRRLQEILEKVLRVPALKKAEHEAYLRARREAVTYFRRQLETIYASPDPDSELVVINSEQTSRIGRVVLLRGDISLLRYYRQVCGSNQHYHSYTANCYWPGWFDDKDEDLQHEPIFNLLAGKSYGVVAEATSDGTTTEEYRALWHHLVKQQGSISTLRELLRLFANHYEPIFSPGDTYWWAWNTGTRAVYLPTSRWAFVRIPNEEDECPDDEEEDVETATLRGVHAFISPDTDPTTGDLATTEEIEFLRLTWPDLVVP